MRVLLPLRKPTASKDSSSEDLQALEHAEGVEVDETLLRQVESNGGALLSIDGVEVYLPPDKLLAFFSEQQAGESPQPDSSSTEVSVAQHPLVNLAKEPVKGGPWKTTGLHEPDQKKPAASIRKRPRPAFEDSRKRPAIERKPAATPSSITMGLGTPGKRAAQDSSSFSHHKGTSNKSQGWSIISRNDMGAENLSIEQLVVNDNSYRTPAPSNSPDSIFFLELKKRGLEVKEQDGDGNCLFRAVALQVYGDPSMHGQVRQQCMDFMERDKEHFSQFVTGEDFASYIQRKRQDGVHGNNPEIQAISELFNRPIEVFSPDKGATPLNIFHAEYKTDDQPIRLSYHDRNHYNAVVDPLIPTAGLGLGLPGLQPGLADKMQMAKAVAESDATADQMELQRALKESQDDELQRAIKESKLSSEHMRSHEAMALSDVDATYFELEQAALEYSLQSHFQLEHGKKQSASAVRERKDRATNSNSNLSLSLCAEAAAPLSNVASLPSSSTNVANEASLPHAAVAAAAASISSILPVASVASAVSPAAAKPVDDISPIRPVDDYPPVVQEMVMNGFELGKVVRAVDLIGENFDDLLAFLMNSVP